MIGMRIKKQIIIENKKRKSRGSRITTSILFTRLQKALKLKFAPHFAPLINLLNQT
jgi:hypothetical protein